MARWSTWVLYVVAWSAALLTPLAPLDDSGPDDHASLRRFVFSKVVHLAAYGLLAALTGWLLVPLRARLWLLFAIMVHAPLGEALQAFVPGRTSAVTDVLLDHLGILCGLAATWRWWAREPEPRHENPRL